MTADSRVILRDVRTTMDIRFRYQELCSEHAELMQTIPVDWRFFPSMCQFDVEVQSRHATRFSAHAKFSCGDVRISLSIVRAAFSTIEAEDEYIRSELTWLITEMLIDGRFNLENMVGIDDITFTVYCQRGYGVGFKPIGVREMYSFRLDFKRAIDEAFESLFDFYDAIELAQNSTVRTSESESSQEAEEDAEESSRPSEGIFDFETEMSDE